MKNKKDIKKISLLTFTTSLLSLGNMNQSSAQTNLVQVTNNLNLRSGPSTKESIICTINKGTKIEILDSLGEWTKIKYLNHIGFVSTQYLKNIDVRNNITIHENTYLPSDIKIMECNVELLSVRFGPSTTEKVLGTLKKGDKVEILYEVNRNWARIKYNNGHGYVSLQYLTEINSNPIPSKPITMYCNTSSLNIRKKPSSQDAILNVLKRNDTVNVVEFLNNGWCRIKYNDEYAYVSSQYLSKHVSTETFNNSSTMICSANLLNVRSGPSFSENIIGYIKKNDLVEVIYHVSTGWTKIKYSNRYGYVSTIYLDYI